MAQITVINREIDKDKSENFLWNYSLVNQLNLISFFRLPDSITKLPELQNWVFNDIALGEIPPEIGRWVERNICDVLRALVPFGQF